MNWLLGDREDIDQEGLLAERTLLISPRRQRRDDAEGGDEPPAASGDETR